MKKFQALYMFLIFAVACSSPNIAPATSIPTVLAPTPLVVPAMVSPTSTSTPTLTLTPSPTFTSTPTASPTPPPENIVGQFVSVNWDRIRERRAKRAHEDPSYVKRIDAELNKNRVNFMFTYRGETHEPPQTEWALIGSATVVSYNRLTGRMDLFSMTHDVRAPRVEEFALGRAQNNNRRAMRIDSAYSVGGIPLMRQVWEEATGLSIDFTVYFKDVLIADFIDDVLGKIEIDPPLSFKLHPYYVDGFKYPERQFEKGKIVKLGGKEVLGFIKAVPFPELGTSAYHPRLEHNLRLQKDVVPSLVRSYETRDGRKFWLGVSTFVAKRGISAINPFRGGEMELEFDPDALPMAVPFIEKMKSAGGNLKMPEVGVSVYAVDSSLGQGDGGVQWVTANAAINPITQRDFNNGIYAGPDFEIPLDANPYGDQVLEYWPSVRSLVKKKFGK